MVCPLFEFVTGFEMEATGWENIRTRALLLGMMPKEIDRKIESIAKFSNLGEFLDIPVRHYSTGCTSASPSRRPPPSIRRFFSSTK
jgi:ABC-type polysaccharide/polyol phosphate transport system ATPase subunit